MKASPPVVSLGEVLARATVDLPVVAPFIEIGGGAGQGQLHSNDTNAAQLSGMGSHAYLGAGLSLKVPFMPLFEIRAGNRLISTMETGNRIIRISCRSKKSMLAVAFASRPRQSHGG